MIISITFCKKIKNMLISITFCKKIGNYVNFNYILQKKNSVRVNIMADSKSVQI
jgi:hypothetical protein